MKMPLITTVIERVNGHEERLRETCNGCHVAIKETHAVIRCISV